jgi:hypothetical protein
MKLALLLAAALAPLSAAAADGFVRLSNYPGNNPIFFFTTSTRLPVDGSFVQVLGGPRDGSLQVLSSSTGQTVFTLTEPGFFDAGFGVVPGVPEGTSGFFQLKAWRNAPDFETALRTTGVVGQSVMFSALTGTVTEPAQLETPSFLMCADCVPEPSTFLLGLLGAGALLVRRRCV